MLGWPRWISPTSGCGNLGPSQPLATIAEPVSERYDRLPRRRALDFHSLVMPKGVRSVMKIANKNNNSGFFGDFMLGYKWQERKKRLRCFFRYTDIHDMNCKKNKPELPILTKRQESLSYQKGEPPWPGILTISAMRLPNPRVPNAPGHTHIQMMLPHNDQQFSKGFPLQVLCTSTFPNVQTHVRTHACIFPCHGET